MSTVAGPAGTTDSDRTSQITPLILTLNEAPNIGRCLERLAWAARVIVLDSGSTDDTTAIARRFPNVEIHERPFDDHASQWNYGLTLVGTPWVLTLDADYVVPTTFPDEANAFVQQSGLDAVHASIRYVIHGRPLRASLYPPRPVLFRPARYRYDPDGHTQRLRVQGRAAALPTPFDHDDRKPLARWLQSQHRYAELEADKILAPGAALNVPDRLRRGVVFAPAAAFVYTLFVKGTVLDGWPGWYYACQRAVAELVLSMVLLERRINESLR